MSHRPLTYFTVISLAAHAAAIGFWPPTPLTSPSTADTAIEIGLVSLPHISTEFTSDLAPLPRSSDSNREHPPVASVPTHERLKPLRPAPRSPAPHSSSKLTVAEPNTQTATSDPAPSRPSNRSTLTQSDPVTAVRAAPLAAANQPPVYPAEALRYGWEGEVRLRVTITRTGAVGNVIIEQSSDYTILDQAAMDTVRSWKFEPARIGDQTTEGSVQIPIRFRIKRS